MPKPLPAATLPSNATVTVLIVAVVTASTRTWPVVSTVEPSIAAVTIVPIVLMATAPASEPVSAPPDDAAMETAAEPASASMVEVSLPRTLTLGAPPATHRVDPPWTRAPTVLVMMLTVTAPAITAAAPKPWLAATETPPTTAVLSISPFDFASTRTDAARAPVEPIVEPSMTAVVTSAMPLMAIEAAAAMPTVPLPPAAMAAAKPPASASMRAELVAVTMTAPVVLIVLDVIRAAVVLAMSLIEIEPAAASERPNELPDVSAPAIPKARTSISEVVDALTVTDPAVTTAWSMAADTLSAMSLLATATPIDTDAPPLLVRLSEIASAPANAWMVASSIAWTLTRPDAMTVVPPMPSPIRAATVFPMVLIETAPAPERTNPLPWPNPAAPPPAMVTESISVVDCALTRTLGALSTSAPSEMYASAVSWMSLAATATPMARPMPGGARAATIETPPASALIVASSVAVTDRAPPDVTAPPEIWAFV